jgi:glycosyltransferase involved in cell wall biosynthesis
MTSASHQTPPVSVLTPSIPERAGLLTECRLSVKAQTAPCEHLIEIDTNRDGCSRVMNRLAREAAGEWLLPLADDDLLLPGAVATLLAHSDDADIVYAPPLVWGNSDTHFWGEPPCIPSFALVRKTLWHDLGGYDETRRREEDRNLWMKAMNAGARFRKADSGPTWIYRFHGGNKSYNNGVAS